MSDLRFASAEKTPFTGAGTCLVNANAALEKILQNLRAEERSNIILRCDELPFFPGLAADIETVFASLLQMILAKKETASKLYLHISCTGEEGQERRNGIAFYSILFHSNLVLTADWLQQQQQKIEEVKAVVQPYNGGLLVNPATNSGVVFSVSLPGKFL